MDPTRIPCKLKPAPEPVRRAHFEKHRADTEHLLFRGELPSLVDFRQLGLLPPVLDQGALGSCVFNATSNGLRFLMRQARLPDFQPSRLFLYWYTRMAIMPAEENSPPPDPHEDTGAYVHSACATIISYHCCPENLWPYADSTNGPFSREPDAKAQQWAMRDCQFRFLPLYCNNLVELRRALAAGHPVLVGLQIYQRSFMQSQGGMIALPDPGDIAAGGHCILIVGYDDNQQVFIAMNSWTTSWGDNGFCYMPYKFMADPKLSYDWEALHFFSMSTNPNQGPSAGANGSSYGHVPNASVSPGDNRPANAVSGAYFGAEPAKKPSLLQRLCCGA